MVTTRAVALSALALVPGVVLASPPAPRRGTSLCNVRSYGAVGDDSTYDTAAIQAAINDRACGAVILPLGGTFRTGALNLTSDLEFVVDGILKGSDRPEDYPLIPAFPSYGQVRDMPIPPANRFAQHQALLAGWHLKNITIRGQGVIDGNGGKWWARWYAGAQVWGRPRLLEPIFSTGIVIHGVTLKDSPFWTLHPYACRDVHIHDITVTAPRNELAPNSDGIDPDSCSDVLIERVIVDVGDNSMAIKSGMDLPGVREGIPSRNITIRDSHFVSESWAIGSEMSGGVYDVLVDGCTFGDPYGRVWKAGVMIKTMPGRGGEIRNITIRNSVFHKVDRDPSGTAGVSPITVSMLYADAPGTSTRQPAGNPTIKDIHFENIVMNCGGDCQSAGEFMGIAQSHIQNLTFKNIKIGKGHFKGWLCGGVSNIVFSDMDPPGLPMDCPLVSGSGAATPLNSAMKARFASLSTSGGVEYGWDNPAQAPPSAAPEPVPWPAAGPKPLLKPQLHYGLMALAGLMGTALLVMQVVVYRRMRKTSKLCKRIEKVINEQATKEEPRGWDPKANLALAPSRPDLVGAALSCGLGAALGHAPSMGLRKSGGSWSHSLNRLRNFSFSNLYVPEDDLQEPLSPGGPQYPLLAAAGP